MTTGGAKRSAAPSGWGRTPRRVVSRWRAGLPGARTSPAARPSASAGSLPAAPASLDEIAPEAGAGSGRQTAGKTAKGLYRPLVLLKCSQSLKKHHHRRKTPSRGTSGALQRADGLVDMLWIRRLRGPIAARYCGVIKVLNGDTEGRAGAPSGGLGGLQFVAAAHHADAEVTLLQLSEAGREFDPHCPAPAQVVDAAQAGRMIVVSQIAERLAGRDIATFGQIFRDLRLVGAGLDIAGRRAGAHHEEDGERGQGGEGSGTHDE